jgi:hypothetical protein
VCALRSIQAFVGNQQTLDRLPVQDVRFDDLLNVRRRYSPVPNTFRINDHRWSVLALVETSRHVGAHTFLEATQGELLFEEILQLSLTLGIAATAGMSRFPLIAADEEMLLELRHLLNLQDFRPDNCNRSLSAGGRKAGILDGQGAARDACAANLSCTSSGFALRALYIYKLSP